MSALVKKNKFKHQSKELEGICNPTFTKLYQQAGGTPKCKPDGMLEGFPGTDSRAGTMSTSQKLSEQI